MTFVDCYDPFMQQQVRSLDANSLWWSYRPSKKCREWDFNSFDAGAFNVWNAVVNTLNKNASLGVAGLWLALLYSGGIMVTSSNKEP